MSDENYSGPSINPYEDSVFSVKCSRCGEWSNPEEGRVREGELLCVNCVDGEEVKGRNTEATLTKPANETGDMNLPVPVLAEPATRSTCQLSSGEAQESTKILQREGSNPSDSCGGQSLSEPIGVVEVLKHIYSHFELKQ